MSRLHKQGQEGSDNIWGRQESHNKLGCHVGFTHWLGVASCRGCWVGRPAASRSLQPKRTGAVGESFTCIVSDQPARHNHSNALSPMSKKQDARGAAAMRRIGGGPSTSMMQASWSRSSSPAGRGRVAALGGGYARRQALPAIHHSPSIAPPTRHTNRTREDWLSCVQLCQDAAEAPDVDGRPIGQAQDDLQYSQTAAQAQAHLPHTTAAAMCEHTPPHLWRPVEARLDVGVDALVHVAGAAEINHLASARVSTCTQAATTMMHRPLLCCPSMDGTHPPGHRPPVPPPPPPNLDRGAAALPQQDIFGLEVAVHDVEPGRRVHGRGIGWGASCTGQPHGPRWKHRGLHPSLLSEGMPVTDDCTIHQITQSPLNTLPILPHPTHAPT